MNKIENDPNINSTSETYVIYHKNGQKTGRLIIRNTKGQLITKGRYDRNGNKTGTWLWRNPETNQISKRNFDS